MAMETVKTRKFTINKQEEHQQKSLDPLAENFDFDSWAKIVKKQMTQKLYYPFSTYLAK